MSYDDALDTYEKCVYCWLKYLTKNEELRNVMCKGRVDANKRPLVNTRVMAYRHWNAMIYDAYIAKLTREYRIDPRIVRSALAVVGGLSYKRKVEMMRGYEKEDEDAGVKNE